MAELGIPLTKEPGFHQVGIIFVRSKPERFNFSRVISKLEKS